MSSPIPAGPPPPPSWAAAEATSQAKVEEAGRQMRAPWAASIAGLLFAILFTGSLVLMRSQPMIGASDEELQSIFSSGQDLPAFIGGFYLAPFAGIMFLWFMAVIRDQLGEHEDQFFATVFLGSGLLFVAMFFASIAIACAPIIGVRYLGQAPPTQSEIEFLQRLSYSVMFGFGTRSAAVFLFAMASIGLRSGVFPRWFSRVGYLAGIILLVVVAFWDWIILLFPAWIALVSAYILRRERARQRSAEASPTADR